MAWFKVDDGFATSPKVLRIPRAQRLAAVGLWTIAGAWCSQHLTDGEVPAFMLEEWGADVSLGTALVTAGLWVETKDGHRFHDWSDYQPSRADVRATRDKERERKAEWRRKNAGSKGQSHDLVPEESQRDTSSPRLTPVPARPGPTPPDPVKEESRPAKRSTRLPKDWEPDEHLVDWTAINTPSQIVADVLEVFRDYWIAQPGQKGVKADWDATWRGWVRRNHTEAVARGWRPPDEGYLPGNEWMTR